MKSALTQFAIDWPRLSAKGFPNRVLALGLMLLTFAFLSACGGGGGDTNPQVTAPTTTTQPQGVTVTAPATATFNVTTTGTAPLSYQWRKNGDPISGATSASYTTPITTISDNDTKFSVVVTNTVNSVTSNDATLMVNEAPETPTLASFTPASGPVGTRVTLTGTNLTGATTVRFNGTTATSFTPVSATQVTATVPSGATTGRIAVTTSAGTATSSTDFTVDPAPVKPPVILSFSANPSTVSANQSSVLSWNVTGATSLSIDHSVGPVTGSSVTVNPDLLT